jgi:hypothetical protein
MNNNYMQLFIVKFTINYPSGKKFTAERKAYGITRLGAIDTIKWLYSNYKKTTIDIISVTPTGKYSAGAVYGDNHTIGER